MKRLCLNRIAREYGLDTRLRQNFHQFVHEHMDTQEHYQLMERMRVFNDQGTLSRQEWDIACKPHISNLCKKGRGFQQ